MHIHFKYPKTQHILGSKECDINFLPKEFEAKYPSLNDIKKEGELIIEEKMDGIGIGFFFKNQIAYIQFRNHIFTKYDCPANFKNIFNWIENRPHLYFLLKENRILFGEWMELKHCVYYDALPSYFIEYDIFDLDKEGFLDTQSRRSIITQYNLQNHNKLTSAHVIHQNNIKTINELVRLWNIKIAFGKSLDCESTFLEKYPQSTGGSLYDTYPEGFYIKTEKNGMVIGRYKFIRKSFISRILASEHWKNKQAIKNQLILV